MGMYVQYNSEDIAYFVKVVIKDYVQYEKKRILRKCIS